MSRLQAREPSHPAACQTPEPDVELLSVTAGSVVVSPRGRPGGVRRGSAGRAPSRGCPGPPHLARRLDRRIVRRAEMGDTPAIRYELPSPWGPMRVSLAGDRVLDACNDYHGRRLFVQGFRLSAADRLGDLLRPPAGYSAGPWTPRERTWSTTHQGFGGLDWARRLGDEPDVVILPGWGDDGFP